MGSPSKERARQSVEFPRGGLLGTEEEDGNGLDPSEAPLHVVVAPADEVIVDVEVGVG